MEHIHAAMAAEAAELVALHAPHIPMRQDAVGELIHAVTVAEATEPVVQHLPALIIEIAAMMLVPDVTVTANAEAEPVMIIVRYITPNAEGKAVIQEFNTAEII